MISRLPHGRITGLLLVVGLCLTMTGTARANSKDEVFILGLLAMVTEIPIPDLWVETDANLFNPEIILGWPLYLILWNSKEKHPNLALKLYLEPQYTSRTEGFRLESGLRFQVNPGWQFYHPAFILTAGGVGNADNLGGTIGIGYSFYTIDQGLSFLTPCYRLEILPDGLRHQFTLDLVTLAL